MMLIEDPAERERITTLIRELVTAVDAWKVTELDDFADRAVLHAYVGDLVPDSDDISMRAIGDAIAALGQGSARPGLFGGASRVGWMVSHLAGGEVADQVCATLDDALTRRLESVEVEDYDLISGYVGYGVYALERGEAGHSLAVRVLDALEKRAQPRAGGLAWHTGPEQLPPWQQKEAPNGYWNLGLAHGMPGVIGLLARYLTAGIAVERSRALLDQAVTYLLAAEPAPPGERGRYPAWHSSDREPTGDIGGRLAWCYGDLGVSFALIAAGRARGNDAWLAAGLEMARVCSSRDRQQAQITDAGICHGAAGAAHLFHRLYLATKEPAFADAARTWVGHTLALRFDHDIAGFPSKTLQPDGSFGWAADASLLTGTTGVALVLHAMITDVDPQWDRVLLVDI